MSRALPWMKFYPAAWRADPALRMCSLAARGLWVEMLSIMHEAEPYGYLLVNGRPVTDAQLAVLAAAPSDQVPSLLDELESAGVFSRTRKGVIFSRRMVRDEKKSEEGRKSVEKRWKKPISGEDQPTETEGKIPPPNRGPNREPITKRLEDRGKSITDSSLRSESVPDHDPVEEAFAAWNDLARDVGLSEVQIISPQRKSAMRQRLAEAGGLDGFRIALEKIRGDPFFLGEGPRGWKANIDFILTKSKFTKLMEGGYDRNPTPANPRSSHPTPTRDSAFDQVAAELGGEDYLPGRPAPLRR